MRGRHGAGGSGIDEGRDRPAEPNGGLTAAEVERLRAEHGWNELPRPRATSAWTVLARQFTGLLVVMLIGAGLVALALGERIDALAIGAVVVLNGLLGFTQDWRAERAIEALRAMLSPEATVLRDGAERVLPARELVPGDLLLLSEGDRVAADAEVLRETGLMLDESALTGESVPVSRAAGDAVLSGTTVTMGHARTRVTRTGTATEFGQVAQLTGSVETKPTALQRELKVLARQLGLLALFVAALVAGLGFWNGLAPLDVFMLGLSMAVAMVPEGLPAVVTVTLALGAGAMVRQKALVRHLQAVETLGAASVICTDKTGTLTENQMTAATIWTAEAVYEVSGSGYAPEGGILRDGAAATAKSDPALARLCHVGLACSHAAIRQDTDGWHAVGDPTEAALVTLGRKAGCPPADPDRILDETPFTSDRKRMSVLERQDGGRRVLLKGAPELVLATCTRILADGGEAPLDTAAAARVRDAMSRLARDGLRVLALADRPVPEATDTPEEAEMVFLGLVGMIDPPRAEVAGAIAAARAAGIRTLMITGDHPATARNVADQLGIPAATVLTGADLDRMDDAALSEALAGEVAFARVSPAHKLRLVACLQDLGETVAMTGDGVNDAPALRRADIGVAMARRGTEVAKDAADLVLLDDNYATIVKAIREGRRQFDNTRKFVRYLLSSNAGEVIALLVNTAMLAPLIFLPTQILWMNLVTDGVTAVALGLEPSETAQMRAAPRRRDERILSWKSAPVILAFGTYTGLACVWLFEALLPLGVDVARTGAFTGMVVFEKVSVFAFRSLRSPGWRLGYFGNPALLAAFALMLAAQVAAVHWPPLQTLLQTVPLSAGTWATIGALALPLLVVPALVKLLIGLRAPEPPPARP